MKLYKTLCKTCVTKSGYFHNNEWHKHDEENWNKNITPCTPSGASGRTEPPDDCPYKHIQGDLTQWLPKIQ